ncbi:MAG: phosphopentomutase [Phycisphaerae bacterium]
MQHILERCPDLKTPTLMRLGWGRILGRSNESRASWGKMNEASEGKDSTTGHWELAGVHQREPFPVFDKFPAALVEEIEREAGVTFIGNKAASGTAIIAEMGEEHVRTGRPILYTSADSVLQIAAHEEVVPIERLYAICRTARRHADQYRIGRVIARPFVGQPGKYERTCRRHDFSLVPPRTVLNAIDESHFEVIGVGKVTDLFSGRGMTWGLPTSSNADGMKHISSLWAGMRKGLLFANLVDFDTEFGHRRDVAGYARAIEVFDLWLSGFLKQVRRDDLVIVTADHGNDPTFRGTDHTREQVPLLVLHAGRSVNLGVRETFADVAATLAEYFGIEGGWPVGKSFLSLIAPEDEDGHNVPAGSARGASAGGRDAGWPDGRGEGERVRPRAGATDGVAHEKAGAGGDLFEPD